MSTDNSGVEEFPEQKELVDIFVQSHKIHTEKRDELVNILVHILKESPPFMLFDLEDGETFDSVELRFSYWPMLPREWNVFAPTKGMCYHFKSHIQTGEIYRYASSNFHRSLEGLKIVKEGDKYKISKEEKNEMFSVVSRYNN